MFFIRIIQWQVWIGRAATVPGGEISRHAEQHMFAALEEVLCIAVKKGLSPGHKQLGLPCDPLQRACQGDQDETWCGVPHRHHVRAAVFPHSPPVGHSPTKCPLASLPGRSVLMGWDICDSCSASAE